MTEKKVDLKPDPLNANKHTERGLGMLEHSLRTYGAGRSILVDKNGRVIAGNATLERVVDLGIGIKIVESDGKQLVVVKRTDIDLDTPEGRALAIADNRVAEVDLSWDPEVLEQLIHEGVPVEEFFLTDELDRLLLQKPAEPEPGLPPTKRKIIGAECPRCHYKPGDEQ